MPAVPRKVRLPFLVASWSLVVLGCAHLTFMAVASALGPASDEERARQAMSLAASDPVLDIPRSMLALFYGFAAAMGLLLVALGAVNLVVQRAAPDVLRRGAALLAVDAVVCLLAAVIALAAFPLPAIVALVVAFAGYLWALIAQRWLPPQGIRALSASPPRRRSHGTQA